MCDKCYFGQNKNGPYQRALEELCIVGKELGLSRMECVEKLHEIETVCEQCGLSIMAQRKIALCPSCQEKDDRQEWENYQKNPIIKMTELDIVIRFME